MWRCRCSLLAILVGGSLSAQTPPDWQEPVPPFRIAGNLYYVGTKDLASYLITTPQGHILINSTLEENVPLIKRSVEQLGFRFTDIKVLLISHAHWDHAAGSASVKRLTGAQYFVMDGDVDVVESGGNTDFQYGDDPSTLFPPTKVDRILHDGDAVTVGDAVLVAHLTPGHTSGCTTWTMKVREGGRTYDIVIIGSPNVNPGYRLVNNRLYPQIAADYERTFRVLKSLPCDIFLGAHGSYFDLENKYAKLQGAPMPFVDPQGYKHYVAEREAAFRTALDRQRPMRANSLDLTVETNKRTYRTGEPIELTLTLTNRSGRDTTLQFSSGQRYDFQIVDGSSATAWTWSSDRLFMQVLGSERLAPGASREYRERFTGQLAPGTYQLTGSITTVGLPRRATTTITVQ